VHRNPGQPDPETCEHPSGPIATNAAVATLAIGGRNMAGVNGVGCRIILLLVFGVLSPFAARATEFAQAGSTGGTIGKTDKSVSGPEAPPKIQSTEKPSTRAGTGSPCDKVAGSWMWRWLNDSTVVTLSPDRSSSAANGNIGNWTCTGRTLVIVWRISGPDEMTLSPDAKRAAGTGGLGVGVTGTRMSGR
jgi:hypothetical protein